jgi:hypothetical protein
MSKINAVETMSILLGSKYQIISNVTSDPVVLAKLADEDLAPKNSIIEVDDKYPEPASSIPDHSPTKQMRSALVSLRDTPLRLENHPIPTLILRSGIDQMPKKTEKTTDDYLFQFYLGSLTVVGLFVLFRMIQKSR